MIEVPGIVDMIIFFVVLVPSIILLNYYRVLHIRDHLIFGLSLLIVAIDAIINYYVINYPNLLVYQIQFFFINFGILLFFFHILTVRGKLSRSLLSISSIVYFLMLTILILFWHRVSNQPDNIMVVGLSMPYSLQNVNHPQGAAIYLWGHLIYGTSYPMLSDLFFVLVSILFVWTYFRLQPKFITPEVDRAHTLWKLISILLLIYSVLRLSWFRISPMYISVILLLAFILILYISIKLPQGLLMTESQLNWIYDLIIQISEPDNIVESEDLTDYLLLVAKTMETV